MKSKRKKKPIFYILIIFGAMILIYILAWFINYSKYAKLKKQLGYNEKYMQYVLVEDGFSYGVTKPTFLSFTANYSIAQSVHVGDNGYEEDTCDMIIWPHLNGSCDVAYSHFDYETGTTYYLEMNEAKELVTDTQDNRETFELYKNEIDWLYERADELWGICK